MIDKSAFSHCPLPEFVGTALCDTIGLVIANIDDSLRVQMGFDPAYRSVGILSSRTGAAGQLMAVDEAVKSTNTTLLTVQLPRDTKGWGGHGSFIVLGAREVSDARRAVELALALTDRHVGELYISDAGHLEMQYSARSGAVLSQVFGIPEGQAFGFSCASPAAIGLVMADIAVKAGNVVITDCRTPDKGTSHSNEVITVFTGETNAVHSAVLSAREAGLSMLGAMGSVPKSANEPYLK